MMKLNGNALNDLVKTRKFYWFLGHVFTIIFFICNVITGLVNPYISLRYYQYALVSIIISYTLIIVEGYYKKGIKFLNFSHSLVGDYNLQYLLLTIILYCISFTIGQIRSNLYSFVLYSVIHVLGYIQKHLGPIFISREQVQKQFNSRITRIINVLNRPVMFIAAVSEIVTMILAGFQFVTSILLLLINWDLKLVGIHFLVFILFVVFVKLRYEDNPCTHSVVNMVDARIYGIVNQINNLQLLYVYHILKDLGIKYLHWIQVTKDT